MSLKVYKVESMKIERFEDIIGEFTSPTWTSHNQKCKTYATKTRNH